MDELFVPYDIAQKLNLKGFNDPCCRVFNGKNKLGGIGNELIVDELIQLSPTKFIKAPMYQQVVDWLREKYDIVLSVSFNQDDVKYEYQGLSNKSKSPWFAGVVSTDYYATLGAGIREALKMI